VARVRKYLTAAGLAAGLIVAAAACGGSAHQRALSTTSTPASSGATGSAATTTTAVSSAAIGSGAPVGTGGATTPASTSASGRAGFLTPSGNISCEIDYRSGASGDAAFCETLSPAESASLAPDGSVKICGLACEGNAAENTPTLAYGTSTGLGPFQCYSAQDGVTCTVSGKGFEISRSGISPVGAPLADLAPGSYSGTVASLSADVSQMTFTISSTGCNGIPSPGTWSVDLTGATFVANSEPDTGQGQAVTISRSQWQQDQQTRRAWTVVVNSGQPLEVTDGPAC
jgi:hypothetical protein